MSEDVLEELDKEQKGKIEETRKEIKERRYLNSLTLVDLGAELQRAEELISENNENGSRLDKTKEYRDKWKKEIDSRMEVITEHEKEME